MKAENKKCQTMPKLCFINANNVLVHRLRKEGIKILNSSPYHSPFFKRFNLLFIVTNRN